jgi:hypothetical protein
MQSSTKFTPMQRTIFRELNVQPITRVSEPTIVTKKADEIVKIDELSSNWIENASYFLREHEIEVLNFLSVDEITLRLKNCEFSVDKFLFKIVNFFLIFILNKRQYEKLKEKMRIYYTNNNKKCNNIEENQVCVAKSKNAYFRVQIIEILKTQVRLIIKYFDFFKKKIFN